MLMHLLTHAHSHLLPPVFSLASNREVNLGYLQPHTLSSYVTI